MDRFTTKENPKAELIGCVYCLEYSNCYSNMSCDEIYNALSKLRYYEDLEEQGKLMTMPCNIGDTVWFIPKYEGKVLGMIREDKVQMVGITTRGIHLKLRDHHDHNKMYMLGKTVFLTKEEAEAALNND